MQQTKVLVVDDEELNCQLLEMALEDLYEVKSVNSGEDCLNALSSFEPAIVLLDVNMPGMTGFEVCKLLKAQEATASIPVLFLTALESGQAKAEAKEVGGSGFLTKPIDLDQLIDKVKETIVEAS